MIRVIFTKSFGQIIGDVTTDLLNETSIKNPCVVQVGRDQIGLVPLMGVVKEDTLVIPESEMIGGLHEPIEEIYNHYNAQFGSGIQLVTAPSSIIK